MKPALGVLFFSDGAVAELGDLAEECEALGYDYFWYTDVRFARECYVGLAHIAMRTKHMRIGPGVTDPYSRHPASTASAVATLDELSDGRALLGLGVGGAGFKQLGLETPLPVAALREAVATIRGLLRGEEVTTEGKVISLYGGKLSFAPRRAEIPVYFATHGAQITRLAGQIADGVLIANVLDPESFAFYLGKVDEGMQKVGRAPGFFDIGLRVEACICEDEDAARAVMRRRVAARVLSQHPHWEYLDKLAPDLPAPFRELGARLLPLTVLEAMALAGNVERVAGQLARALVPRISQLTLRPHAAPGQRVAEVVRAFAERVVPRALEIRATSQAA